MKSNSIASIIAYFRYNLKVSFSQELEWFNMV